MLNLFTLILYNFIIYVFLYLKDYMQLLAHFNCLSLFSIYIITYFAPKVNSFFNFFISDIIANEIVLFSSLYPNSLDMIDPAHKSSFNRNPDSDVEESLHVSKAFALDIRSSVNIGKLSDSRYILASSLEHRPIAR